MNTRPGITLEVILPTIANNNVPAAISENIFPTNFAKPWTSLTFDFSIPATIQPFHIYKLCRII
jgi:hypothetical protein